MMEKKKKIKWMKPKLESLSDIESTVGACGDGSTALDDCGTGGSALGLCGTGGFGTFTPPPG